MSRSEIRSENTEIVIKVADTGDGEEGESAVSSHPNPALIMDENNGNSSSHDFQQFSSSARTSRRPTMFTVLEDYEFGPDEFQRKLSSVSYSSNSSLESESGETWRSRAGRRVSVVPVSMGLQPWVKGASLTSSPSSGIPGGGLSLKKKKKYEDIKNLVKAGKISAAKGAVRDGDWDYTEDIRTRLWPFLDSIHESTHAGGDYWDTVKEIFSHERNEIPNTPISLPGPCPKESALYYKLDEAGIWVCNRICSVIIYAFPDITHCPLLCPLVALFLHYMDEEKVHSCIGTLLTAKHKVFLTQTKVQADVCSQTALALTRKFSKSTYSQLVRQLGAGENMEVIFTDWAWWIFRDLPLQHLVRVMDCFLMEGIKVLYRVTIGLLNHYIKQPTTPGPVLKTCISENCQSIQLSPARLLKAAFSIRNFRSTEIRRVTTKLQFQVRTESRLSRPLSTDSIPTSKSQVDICGTSRTLNVKELLAVWQWLPVRITMYEPQLIYTTNEHGCSLTTFFNRVEDHEPTLLLLKATSGEIFGAYCSSAWAIRNEKDGRGERQRYFGTGETFLFGLHPNIIKYPWIGIKGKVEHAAELFMHADSNMISIGGGEGTGIQIDSDLRYGKSERCLTFDNEPLVAGGDFEVQVIEVFAFSIM